MARTTVADVGQHVANLGALNLQPCRTPQLLDARQHRMFLAHWPNKFSQLFDQRKHCYCLGFLVEIVHLEIIEGYHHRIACMQEKRHPE
jgi:hypothetical protein